MTDNTTENRLLFIYTETSLHTGSGRSLGHVDLPIQRERVTGYPMVQSSSLKGRLRADVRQSNPKKYTQEVERNDKKVVEDSDELKAIFGAADSEGQSYAGAVTPSDARLLLLPVRSLQGVFAWVTSRDVLCRFQRDVVAMGFPALEWNLPDSDPPVNDNETECWAGKNIISEKEQVTLEEFTYKGSTPKFLKEIGNWLARYALPQELSEYRYWRDNLPHHLVILPREDFRDFARYGTEVQTHIRIGPDTKTVQGGALWTVESLPSDTLLYAPLIISNSRAQTDNLKTAAEIAEILQEVLHDQRTHLGGHETTGQGVVMLHFYGPTEVKNG